MKPWHEALRVAAQNLTLRRRIRQLERQVLSADSAKKDQRIRILTADLSVVRLCARDRNAVDEYLKDAHDLNTLEDPSAFGETG